MAMPDQICKRCILPASFPGARFNEEGLCHFCQDAPPPDEILAHRDSLKTQVEAAIAENRGKGAYDCIVALSGGKDSSYTLKRLVEDYELNCLAITIDNGFLADEALTNCREVTSALGVDHILFKPNRQFMNTMYRTSVTAERLHSPAALTRASSICNSCISLINAQMMRFAQQFGAGIIAGGYIGGQVPKDMAVLRIDPTRHDQLRRKSVEKLNDKFGCATDKYFNYSVTSDGAAGVEISVINPMLAYLISEDDIMDALRPLSWRRPQRTGITSTNCLLNDFGVYVHHKKHGFHPYALEIAEQVRSGLLSRDGGLRKLNAIPSREDVEDLAEAIGLEGSEY
jgi:7-cyano-7-deazaguanine synthase in queuosine biosynthesis